MQDWQKGLRKFGEMLDGGFSAISPVLGEIDETLSAGVMDNFDRQVDEDGNAWPPRVDTLSHPMLIKSGRMFVAAGGGAGHKFEVSGDEATFGIYEAAVSYAIFHHVGTSRMPQRRVVYASAATRRMVHAVVEVGYRSQLLRLGFRP